MNLYVRLFRVLLGGWIQTGSHYADTTLSRFRVWLHDLDAFGHMNNGRYLQIMDVARTHWMVRTGVLGAILVMGATGRWRVVPVAYVACFWYVLARARMQ